MTTYLLSENEYRRFTGEAVPRRWKKDGDQEPVAADSAVDEILRALVKDASPTEFRQHVVLVAGYRGD